MTTKLTLTIDDAVISRAKRYSQKQGKSLSELIENYLQSLTSKEEPEETIAPQIRKLLGVIKVSDDFDYKKELTKGIVKKHNR